MGKKAAIVTGGLLIGGSIIGGIIYALTRKEEGEEKKWAKPEFKGLGVAYSGVPSSPYIEKFEGDIWGGTLTLQHRGAGGRFYVGLGLSYGKLTGHNPPFEYVTLIVDIPDDLDWTAYTYEATSLVGDWIEKNKLLDVQRFISDSLPVENQQPPNPYGVNTWDDEVYVVTGVSAFQALTVVYA